MSKKIVNISNKVTDRIDELEDGHQLWWETARSVMARLVNDLCRRSRGIEGTVSESEMDRERGSFMKLSYIKVQSLFEEEDDAKYSFEAVKDFIGESFTELRKVYKAYGAMGGGSTMSMHEFLAMIRDCKLIDKSFMNIMKDFIKKNNTITNMFNSIKLLLLGFEENINIAGLLFGLTKDNHALVNYEESDDKYRLAYTELIGPLIKLILLFFLVNNKAFSND